MSIQVNIYETKTNLSRLINRVLEGEEVIIAKSGKPVAKLIPFRKSSTKPIVNGINDACPIIRTYRFESS